MTEKFKVEVEYEHNGWYFGNYEIQFDTNKPYISRVVGRSYDEVLGRVVEIYHSLKNKELDTTSECVVLYKYMKKTILGFTLALIGLISVANAQETYVGAQYVRVNPDVRQPNFRFDRNSDSLGGVVSVTNYKGKTLGLTAEASAVFSPDNDKSQFYTGLGGITLKSWRYASVQPFIKGLAGFSVARVGNILGDAKMDTSFAYKGSVGVDLGKGKTKYRLLEAGVLRTNFYGQNQTNLLLSTGIVF